MIRYLKKAVVEEKKDLQMFANDFCANVKESVKEKLLFLNNIFTIKPESEEYMKNCEEGLKNP